MQNDPAVDAYFARVPPEQRRLLDDVRRQVRELVPDAVELLSYAMPGFKYDGRFLLSYAAWKHHCSVYTTNSELMGKYARQLAGYGRTKSALHFTEAQPLPEGFLEDLLRGRIARIRAGAR